MAEAGRQPERPAGAQLDVDNLRSGLEAAHHPAFFASFKLKRPAQLDRQANRDLGLFTFRSAPCSGQVISDSAIDFSDVDSRSKALGDILPSFECNRFAL